MTLNMILHQGLAEGGEGRTCSERIQSVTNLVCDRQKIGTIARDQLVQRWVSESIRGFESSKLPRMLCASPPLSRDHGLYRHHQGDFEMAHLGYIGSPALSSPGSTTSCAHGSIGILTLPSTSLHCKDERAFFLSQVNFSVNIKENHGLLSISTPDTLPNNLTPVQSYGQNMSPSHSEIVKEKQGCLNSSFQNVKLKFRHIN